MRMLKEFAGECTKKQTTDLSANQNIANPSGKFGTLKEREFLVLMEMS